MCSEPACLSGPVALALELPMIVCVSSVLRCSQLASAGAFVCVKASYCRFVCELAGIFASFAEGMDEKTAIFRARQRWHTWPVKRALHLAVQLLPRLWRVGARACGQGDAQPVKAGGDLSGGMQRHAAITRRLLISAGIHQRHSPTVHRTWSLLYQEQKHWQISTEGPPQ